MRVERFFGDSSSPGCSEKVVAAAASFGLRRDRLVLRSGQQRRQVPDCAAVAAQGLSHSPADDGDDGDGDVYLFGRRKSSKPRGYGGDGGGGADDDYGGLEVV